MANVVMYISLAAPPDAIIHSINLQAKSDGFISGHQQPEMMTLAMKNIISPTMTTCPAVTILTSTRRRVPVMVLSTAIATVSRVLKSNNGVRKRIVIARLKKLNIGLNSSIGSIVVLLMLARELLFIAAAVLSEANSIRAEAIFFVYVEAVNSRTETHL